MLQWLVMRFLKESYHSIKNPIGAVWLIQYFNIELAFPLYLVSRLGGRRESHREDDFREEVYQFSKQPAATVIAHLQFYLRHEIPQYELMYRLFHKIEAALLVDWIDNEPTGQYARRAGFLYEWLTGNTLTITANISGNYVDALDDAKVVTASPDKVTKNSRWRINNNLAGTPDFCPMVVKTTQVEQAAQLDIVQMLQSLNHEFGEDLLLRSAVWLTLRESKASFIIEGEGKQTKRIERFAQVIAQRTGKGDLPITDSELTQLQQAILGEKTALPQLGIRKSPVFIGQIEQRTFTPIVHYIAPPFEQVVNMLAGLQSFFDVTQGQPSIMRAAVLSFAFVYIHPLADGNGRVHRFLVNDLLYRDGILSEPMILPISSAISDSTQHRRDYDKILDTVSKPLMAQLIGEYQFETTQIFEDGIKSNLYLGNVDNALPIWRFLDLTPHVLYLAKLVSRVIQDDLYQESHYLYQHNQARDAIKELMDMPNDYADRIIRSIRDNQGERSQKLVKEMPFLADDTLWQQLFKAVTKAFKN